MASEENNRGAFRIQEFYCRKMDAPIYADICVAIADGLTRGSETGRRVLDWPGQPTRDALPLRLRVDDGADSYRGVLRHVFDELLQAIGHADVPLYRIVHAANPERSRRAVSCMHARAYCLL